MAPGIEFVLQEAQEPHLFVIKRQYRSNTTTVTAHAVYYILEGGASFCSTAWSGVCGLLCLVCIWVWGLDPRLSSVSLHIKAAGVYQAPTLHAAMSARLARCMHSMRTAFSRMQEDLDPTLIGAHCTRRPWLYTIMACECHHGRLMSLMWFPMNYQLSLAAHI